MGDLTSAGVPEPGAGDHCRGEGPLAVIYMDLACPHCAAFWADVRDLALRVCVRHFPIESRRPRAPALHAACEAAARQSEAGFWELWDSLYADRGRTDDPHLWERAERAGLDLERFERDRRSDEVLACVRRDFESGIRCGVTGTPSVFVAGALVPGGHGEGLAALRALAGHTLPSKRD